MRELRVGDVAAFVPVNQKVADFLSRVHRYSQKMREFLMPEASKPFGDVTSCRSGGVLALIAVLEISDDVRLCNYFEDQTS